MWNSESRGNSMISSMEFHEKCDATLCSPPLASQRRTCDCHDYAGQELSGCRGGCSACRGSQSGGCSAGYSSGRARCQLSHGSLDDVWAAELVLVFSCMQHWRMSDLVLPVLGWKSVYFPPVAPSVNTCPWVHCQEQGQEVAGGDHSQLNMGL